MFNLNTSNLDSYYFPINKNKNFLPYYFLLPGIFDRQYAVSVWFFAHIFELPPLKLDWTLLLFGIKLMFDMVSYG